MKNSAFSPWLMFLVLFGFLHSNAYAQYPSAPNAPPVRYQFGATVGYYFKSYPVASRMDLCTAWMQEMNPPPPNKPTWSNPRVYPNAISDPKGGNFGKTMDAACLFTSIYGDPDVRSPGFAYCGDDYASSSRSPFVVDQFKMECVCPPGTLWFSDVQKCIQVSKLTGSSIPAAKGSNLGPPPVPDCNCKAPPQPSLGEPINPGTGNMWHIENDFDMPGAGSLSLKRVYNSSPMYFDGRVKRTFGNNWTQIYDSALRQETPSTIKDGTQGFVCWQRSDTGFKWCESAPAPIRTATPSAISIFRGDGKRYFFNLVNGVWQGDADTNDRVSAIYDVGGTTVIGWTYKSAEGDVTENYDANGVLVAIATRAGVIQKLTYSDGTTNNTSVSRLPLDAPACSHIQEGDVLPAGRLLCVTDQWGRQLQFEYDTVGRIARMLDPKAQSYAYEYDGPSGGCSVFDPKNPSCSANNLTKITYPDGRSRTYVYNEAVRINNGNTCSGLPNRTDGLGPFVNALTGVIDENGQRYITWFYDCSGLATSSQLGSGANKVAMTYSTSAGQSLLQYSGDASAPTTTSRTLAYTKVLNVAKIYYVDQSCADCGPNKARTYDANGNVTSTTDWNGHASCYQYDLSRNLEVARVEGLNFCNSAFTSTTLTPPARKTSTKWHDIYRLPIAIAGPRKLTTFTYDASGNVIAKTEQATSDVSGVLGFAASTTGTPRTWTYTYNSVGQVLSIVGPRKDVTDVITYTYDGVGNISSVTNALGQVTLFSNFDENGHVGTIKRPNGATTLFVYSPRGWLISSSNEVDGVTEVTSYEYDGVGQLKKLTLPDGTFLSYNYDDAHRLVGISDVLGNSVRYKLDIRGNIVSEQINDPNGMLTRQISRVFDINNTMTKLIGVAQ